MAGKIQHLSSLPKETIEQKVCAEEKKFTEALKADAEFHVLKSIRQRINQLKAELSKEVNDK